VDDPRRMSLEEVEQRVLDRYLIVLCALHAYFAVRALLSSTVYSLTPLPALQSFTPPCTLLLHISLALSPASTFSPERRRAWRDRPLPPAWCSCSHAPPLLHDALLGRVPRAHRLRDLRRPDVRELESEGPARVLRAHHTAHTQLNDVRSSVGDARRQLPTVIRLGPGTRAPKASAPRDATPVNDYAFLIAIDNDMKWQSSMRTQVGPAPHPARTIDCSTKI